VAYFKKVTYVRNLIFKLCLPQDLKICFVSQFPPKNEPLCIILSFYKNWSQKARSRLDYPPSLHVNYMCGHGGSLEVVVPSDPDPSPPPRPPPQKKWGQNWIMPAPDSHTPDVKTWQRESAPYPSTWCCTPLGPAFFKHELPKIFCTTI
jgi:hypothetical protein